MIPWRVGFYLPSTSRRFTIWKNLYSIQLGRAAMPNKTISHVNMQQLATFVILLVMSPVLLILVVVSTTYLLRVLLALSGILE